MGREGEEQECVREATLRGRNIGAEITNTSPKECTKINKKHKIREGEVRSSE